MKLAGGSARRRHSQGVSSPLPRCDPLRPPSRIAGDRMNARRLLCLIALALAAVATAAPASPAASEKAVKDGGIVRMGTTEPFDSMNPFVAFQAISYEVFTNVYPVLV